VAEAALVVGDGHRHGPRGCGGNTRGHGRASSGLKVIIKPHKHMGIFIAKGKESMLVTKNLVPSESIYSFFFFFFLESAFYQNTTCKYKNMLEIFLDQQMFGSPSITTLQFE
jgi:hypothetical protein